MQNKLALRTEGPFRVIAVDSNNVSVMRDGLKDLVSKERVGKIPWKKKVNRVSSARKQASSGNNGKKPVALQTMKKTKLEKE